jgi:hypothetical protein
MGGDHVGGAISRTGRAADGGSSNGAASSG